MRDTFVLRETKEGKIVGYEWEVANPDKVICIIHGIGEHCGRYERMADNFIKNNFAVLSMDLRGHGLSMNKPCHCAPRKKVLEDITCLIKCAQEKYPNKPIVLYGHSMGGNITFDYRSRGQLNDIPVGYVISAPWIRLVQPTPKPMVAVVKAISKIKPNLTIGSAVDESKLGHPESVGPYSKDPLVHDKISMETAYEGFTIGEAIEKGTNIDNGKAHKIPTLLMHGSEDAICSVEGSRILAKRMEEQKQNAQYKEWEGLLHEIHNGNQESKGDEVIQFATNWIKEL